MALPSQLVGAPSTTPVVTAPDQTGHRHTGEVDSQGNGWTAVAAKHDHPIRKWLAQTAGKPPHTHKMIKAKEILVQSEAPQQGMAAAPEQPSTLTWMVAIAGVISGVAATVTLWRMWKERQA